LPLVCSALLLLPIDTNQIELVPDQISIPVA
jgi:hypothetical protein